MIQLLEEILLKTNRLQFKYRESASKLHQKVGDLLRSGTTLIGQHEAYQEYPVNRVNPTCKNGRLHFDWVIPHLKIVIEVHGEQHFKIVAFDGDYEAAAAGFEELKARDAIKKEAALAAGFIYIMIPYSTFALLDGAWLVEACKLGQEELRRYNEEHMEEQVQEQQTIAVELAERQRIKQKEIRQRYLTSEKHQEELRLAREFRKQRYRKLKEFKQRQDGTRP